MNGPCGLFVCVCVISFSLINFLSSSLVWPLRAFFVCGGLCVRYLGRMVDALAC